MQAGTRLDSVHFRLTPTRTRCDLVINANGKMEKIASGLLEPFLAHLKSARDQIAEGGYSIILEPDHGSDAKWFTKGTMERFVRFVNTPEVLERVITIESEMLQIDDAVAIHSSNDFGSSTVKNHQSKSMKGTYGHNSAFEIDSQKAIIVFETGMQQLDSNGRTTLEENSKFHPLRVIGIRKTALQNEQGMAFARAAAAGFEMNQMLHLFSFAEFFGASRLMEACVKFMDLWKRKHETWQWHEMEAIEQMPCKSDFSSLNPGHHMCNGELGRDGDGEECKDAVRNVKHERPLMNFQVTSSPDKFFQVNDQRHVYTQLPVHPQSSAPPFQSYPMPGIPYYRVYQAGIPFFKPSLPAMEDPTFISTHGVVPRRNPLDSEDGNAAESRACETSFASERSQHDKNLSMSAKVAHGRGPFRGESESDGNQSDIVVIKNINYIMSKRENAKQVSESGNEEETEIHSNVNSKRYSKDYVRHRKSNASLNSNNRDDLFHGQEVDSGNWQAFQSCLLRDVKDGMDIVEGETISSSKGVSLKKRQSRIGSDSILHQRDLCESSHQCMPGFDLVTVNKVQTCKQKASSDVLKSSHRRPHLHGDAVVDSHPDLRFTEIDSARGIRRGTHDASLLLGKRNVISAKSNSDLFEEGEFSCNSEFNENSVHNVKDESFIVPFRTGPSDQNGSFGSTTIEIDLEVPTALRRNKDCSSIIKTQLNYEPDDLSLVPAHVSNRKAIDYDPSINYEIEIHAVDGGTMVNSSKKKDITNGGNLRLKKLDKDKKFGVPGPLLKMKVEEATRKGKISKSNILAEAQACGNKKPAFKTNLQKIKREKEDEERKRLEDLKRERQKRIAARSSSSAQLLMNSRLIKSRVPTKLAPDVLMPSRFSDSEPISFFPMQNLPGKFACPGSSQRPKLTRASSVRHATENVLSQSAPSVTRLQRKGTVPELKTNSSQMRRRMLDPCGGRNDYNAKMKSRESGLLPKSKSLVKPEISKISALINLDKSKLAKLPELKIKTARSNSNIIGTKSVAKEMEERKYGNRYVSSESIKPKKNAESLSNISTGDAVVIEKTAMIVAPVAQMSEESIQLAGGASNDGKGQAGVEVMECATINAAASPIIINEVDMDPSQLNLDVDIISKEVISVNPGDEMPRSACTNVTQKPYLPPFARISSMEDPCTSISEYREVPINSEIETVVEAARVRFSNSVEINTLELYPQGKDSSKGFRQLLKFRRKNHNLAADDRGIASDKLSFDGAVTDCRDTSSKNSNEVHSLKKAASQDGSLTSTSHKVSRHFSLLSPFRSGSNEKKMQHNTAIIYKV